MVCAAVQGSMRSRWPCHICNRQPRPAQVLELGAGPGVAGLVAARLARRCYLTDYHDEVRTVPSIVFKMLSTRPVRETRFLSPSCFVDIDRSIAFHTCSCSTIRFSRPSRANVLWEYEICTFSSQSHVRCPAAVRSEVWSVFLVLEIF